MNDTANMIAEFEAMNRRQREVNSANAAAIFDALTALGVTRIDVIFDGCGDSGQIEDVSITGGDGKLTGEVTYVHAQWRGDDLPQTCALAEAVENLCYALLEHEHGGWQDNDGAFGEFTFDVPKRTVELEFNSRYTDYATSMHTFGEA